MNKKMFWTITMSFVLIFALAACGSTTEPTAELEAYNLCDDTTTRSINSQAGSAAIFHNDAQGPYWLSVEGNELVFKYSESGIFYRETISPTNVFYLYGEALESQEGIRITAQSSGNEICFVFDFFPLQNFDELVLMQPNIDWAQLSAAVRERSPDSNNGLTSISVGVLNSQTRELMLIPSGLTLPHSDNWVNPSDHIEGRLNTFFVPEGQVDGAISRIEYVPQPGWELSNMVSQTASDGSQFVIFVASPTVPVINLTPFGYKGPVTRLLTRAILLNDGSLIPLNGLLVSGNENVLGGETNIMVEIPVSPYDVNGIENFLMGSRALVSDDYSQTTNAQGFLWKFNIYEGTLNYYFENAN